MLYYPFIQVYVFFIPFENFSLTHGLISVSFTLQAVEDFSAYIPIIGFQFECFQRIHSEWFQAFFKRMEAFKLALTSQDVVYFGEFCCCWQSCFGRGFQVPPLCWAGEENPAGPSATKVTLRAQWESCPLPPGGGWHAPCLMCQRHPEWKRNTACFW